MEQHKVILNEYQSSGKNHRDHMWMQYRFLRNEFDGIDARKTTDASMILRNNKWGYSIHRVFFNKEDE